MARKQNPRLCSVATVLMLLFASLSRAEHHETWVEVRSPHFTVLSNAGEHEGRLTAQQFEEIRAMFEQRYPKLRVDWGKPTVIFALKNEESLKLFLPGYGKDQNAMRLSGSYRMAYDQNYALVRTDVRGTGPFPYHALYHEYTHAHFRLNYRGLPLWLTEGVAELYGNTKIEGKDVKTGGVDEAQLRLLRENPLIPIATLVSIDSSSPLYNTRDHSGLFYTESWALVHYLMFSKDVGDTQVLNKYLANLHDSDDPVEAAKKSFGDLNVLTEKLEAYAHQTTFGYQKIPLALKISDKDFAVRNLPLAEGLLARAGYLLRSNHLPEGWEVLRQVAAMDPNTRGYHTELGYYQLQNGDYQKALKEFDLALAADPKDLAAHLYLATALYREFGYTEETTPEIRSHLETVVGLNPDFAPAYAFLSVAYIQRPSPDNQRALDAASRAARLEPGNLSYYIDVGMVLLAEGKFAEARKLADQGRKTAFTARDRMIVASFTKRVDAKANQVSSAPSGHTAESETQSTGKAPSPSPLEPAQAEGKITELICGHLPEVVFTLTTSDSSLLLHIKDTAKIEIIEGQKSSDSSPPCESWKDRHAQVEFTSTPDSVTNGEIRVLTLE